MPRRLLARQVVLSEDASPRPLEGALETLPLYFGDLHNHTGYSDGQGRPDQAYAQLRDRGLDFAAITDHAEPIAAAYAPPTLEGPRAGSAWRAEYDERAAPGHGPWEAAGTQAAAAAGADFLALRGFEYTSHVQGHVCVWGTAAFTDANTLGQEEIEPFWHWLNTAAPDGGADGLAGLNHPGVQPRLFDGLRYRPELEGRVVTMELFNREADYFPRYLQALEQGWHLGAVGVSDHHGRDWGSPAHAAAGLLAESLTWAGIAEALRARRVYAARERGLALAYTADGAWLGSRFARPAGQAVTLEVAVEAAPDGSPLERLELWANAAEPLAVRELGGVGRANWTVPVVPPPGRESWYLVRVLAADRALAYSTPIWVQPT